ncbi:hypothetical protein J1605_000362 [Eschrichtius robustus]|uniref:Uncharacterized protein n=1 Tax=Eschrichtius robustus TaxID=9764 RepID=A0AB34H689_ESCRO|nr:hypothetical protein J1605_000362 [Eschrichtius robustus]
MADGNDWLVERAVPDLAFVWAGNQLERESTLRWRGRGRGRGAVSRETILAGAGGQRGRRAQDLCWSVLALLPRGELGGRRAGRQGVDLQSVGRRPALSLPGSVRLVSGPPPAPKLNRSDWVMPLTVFKAFSGESDARPSNSVVPIPAMEEAVKERIQEIGANEPSWKSVSILTDR